MLGSSQFAPLAHEFISGRAGEKFANTTDSHAARGGKDGPLTLKVQECGLEPEGPVLGLSLQSGSGVEF